MGDDALGEALRAAIARAAREHLPEATIAGHVSGFVLSFDWVDIGEAAGEHLVFVDRDPVITVRGLSRSVLGAARAPDDEPSCPAT